MVDILNLVSFQLDRGYLCKFKFLRMIVMASSRYRYRSNTFYKLYIFACCVRSMYFKFPLNP